MSGRAAAKSTPAKGERDEDGRSLRAERMRERRRREVLDVALRVFSERGYHLARIDDIVREAGVARGTFYLYFESKNAIFHELLDELLGRIRASVAGVDVGPSAAPLREQVLTSVRNVLASFQASPELTRVVLREAVGLDREITRKLEDFYGGLHRWLADSLANGARLGLLREMNVELVAWCVMGSVRQMAQLLVESGGERLDVDAMSAALLDHHLEGVLAR